MAVVHFNVYLENLIDQTVIPPTKKINTYERFFIQREISIGSLFWSKILDPKIIGSRVNCHKSKFRCQQNPRVECLSVVEIRLSLRKVLFSDRHLPKAELDTRNSTKRRLRHRLGEFLVFNSIYLKKRSG